MLAAPNRLRKSSEILKVYRRGSYGGAGIISVKSLSTGLPQSRATVVVAKKVSKRAVVRNRIRRRLTELLRHQWQTVRPGCDIVITVHEDVADAPSIQLSDALRHCLDRSGATKPE